MGIDVRRSKDRGFFDHGFLKTYHTFSFADYYDPNQMGYSFLRVLNEDRLKPGQGFPAHSHRDMEILTVVLEGSLAHKDSIGNSSILKPGGIQLMSAGQGVTHSEYNASDREEVHFLQIWILPDRQQLPQTYQERQLPATRGQWHLVASSDGRDFSLRIHQDVAIYFGRLDPHQPLARPLSKNRRGWLQLIRGKIALNGTSLSAGDGAAISDLSSAEVIAEEPSEALFFDLP